MKNYMYQEGNTIHYSQNGNLPNQDNFIEANIGNGYF